MLIRLKNDIIMINNAFRNDIIKGVFKYIADQINCSCYMSADGKTVMKIFNLRYMSPEIVHYVASVAVKNVDKKNRKQQIYSAIISKYGQKKGLNIYNHIKKHI